MDYIHNRYKEEEAKDFEKFQDFAKDFKKMFYEYSETEYGTAFDILSLTESGGTYAVELKSRNKKYEDTYIEMGKFENLRGLWSDNKVLPIYICFFPDRIMMWKLNEISKINTYLDVEVTSADGRKSVCDRIGLLDKDAWTFKKENNRWRCVKTRENEMDKGVPKVCPRDIFETRITKYNWKNL